MSDSRRRWHFRGRVWAAVAVTLVVAAVLGGYAWVRVSHNAARSESNRVAALLETSGATQYCENGGKGTTYDDPWWEKIFVADEPAAEYADDVFTVLEQAGYGPSMEHVVNSTDRNNRGQTYWELVGARDGYELTARISSHELTLNNCFPRFNDTAAGVVPENYPAVLVMHIRA